MTRTPRLIENEPRSSLEKILGWLEASFLIFRTLRWEAQGCQFSGTVMNVSFVNYR